MIERLGRLEAINSWGYSIDVVQEEQKQRLKVVLVNPTIDKRIKITVLKNVKDKLVFSAYVALLSSDRGDDMIFFHQYAKTVNKPLFEKIKELEMSDLGFYEKLLVFVQLLYTYSDKELEKILTTKYWTKKYYVDPRENY